MNNSNKEILITLSVLLTISFLVFQLTYIIKNTSVISNDNNNKNSNENIMFEPFSFPSSLKDKGFSGLFISEYIADHLNSIRNEVRMKDQVIFIKDIPYIDKIDIKLPGSGLSLKDIVNFFHSFVGINKLRISGHAVVLDKKIYLTVRITGKPSMTFVNDIDKFQSLVYIAAEHILKNIDPFTLGKYYYNKKNIRGMSDIVKHLEYTNPDNEDVVIASLIEGLNMFHQKKYDEALFEWEIANQKDPDNIDALVYQGWALDEMNKPEEAIKRYQKAISLDPMHAGAYNNWGISLYKMGQLKEAVNKFKMITSLMPEYPQAYNNLGYLLYELDKYEEAIGYIKKAITLNHRNPDFYDSLAVIYLKQNRYEDALKQLKKIIHLDPKNAQAYYDLGRTLEKLNRNEESKEVFNKAKELGFEK